MQIFLGKEQCYFLEQSLIIQVQVIQNGKTKHFKQILFVRFRDVCNWGLEVVQRRQGLSQIDLGDFRYKQTFYRQKVYPVHYRFIKDVVQRRTGLIKL